MKYVDQHRRTLLKGLLASTAAGSLVHPARAQSTYRIRQEWQQFKLTSHYASFVNAIDVMRNNTNPLDPASLHYWANVHRQHCPHGAPYFIAWHRGYLIYFEQQLRQVSGNPELNLPYWDYYASPTIPAEFIDPRANNPLRVRRKNTNVHPALDLAPFDPAVFNFQLGTTNAFEPKLEDAPHNQLHNLVGEVMATMDSPLDPVFYLHHANIDRLTHAWALPDGKGIPYSANPYSPSNSDIYWAGNHVYSADLSMERYRTLIPTWLGYDYASHDVPAALPASGPAARTAAAQPAQSQRARRERPPFRSFTPAPGRRISMTRRSLGGAAGLGLDEQSASLLLRLDKKDAAEVESVVAARRRGDGGGHTGSVRIVVDKALLTRIGAGGGYFYALYANMPEVVDSQAAHVCSYFGSIGAFQIAAAAHHGPAQLEFDITDLLARQMPTDYSALSISLVRVDGANRPAGRVIDADELRIDLAYEPGPVPQPGTPAAPKPPGWYGGR